GLPFAVASPAIFETQKVEAGFALAVTTKRDDPCLVFCQFQSEPSQTFFQLAVKALCFLFPPKAADEVVGVADQECRPMTAALEHSYKPPIERIAQAHIRQHP